MKILVGADPELWIYDNKLERIISADGLFPGTKEAPYKVEHGAVQVDGMAAEYNILPAKNQYEFIYYNLSVLASLRDLIKELNPDLDFKFVFDPVADFGAEYIAEQPEHARRLGCTPDFCGWEDGAANPTPDADTPFRTASGHIHVGWTEDEDITDPEFIEACDMLSKQMDMYVGAFSVKAEAKYAGNNGMRRRELYGKAAAYRPKPYGMEYRTSSNVWLQNAEMMSQVYNQTLIAFRDLFGGYRYYEEYSHARDWINSGAVEALRYHGPQPDQTYEWNRVGVDTLDALLVAAKHNAETYGNVAANAAPDFDNNDEDDFNVDEDMDEMRADDEGIVEDDFEFDAVQPDEDFGLGFVGINFAELQEVVLQEELVEDVHP